MVPFTKTGSVAGSATGPKALITGFIAVYQVCAGVVPPRMLPQSSPPQLRGRYPATTIPLGSVESSKTMLAPARVLVKPRKDAERYSLVVPVLPLVG